MHRRINKQKTNCCQSQLNDCIVLKNAYPKTSLKCLKTIVLKNAYPKTSLKCLKTMKYGRRLTNMDRITTQQSIPIRLQVQSPKFKDKNPQSCSNNRPNIANNPLGRGSMVIGNPVGVNPKNHRNQLRVLSPLLTPLLTPKEQKTRLRIKSGSHYMSPEWSNTDLTSILELFSSNRLIS